MTPELEARLRGASVEERNRAILEAHQAGATLREIAALVQLTHGGVRNIIIKGEPQCDES